MREPGCRTWRKARRKRHTWHSARVLLTCPLPLPHPMDASVRILRQQLRFPPPYPVLSEQHAIGCKRIQMRGTDHRVNDSITRPQDGSHRAFATSFGRCRTRTKVAVTLFFLFGGDYRGVLVPGAESKSRRRSAGCQPATLVVVALGPCADLWCGACLFRLSPLQVACPVSWRALQTPCQTS